MATMLTADEIDQGIRRACCLVTEDYTLAESLGAVFDPRMDEETKTAVANRLRWLYDNEGAAVDLLGPAVVDALVLPRRE
jgi:hypothetical protein